MPEWHKNFQGGRVYLTLKVGEYFECFTRAIRASNQQAMEFICDRGQSLPSFDDSTAQEIYRSVRRSVPGLSVLLPAFIPGFAVAQLGPPGFSGVWGPEDWIGWSLDQPFTPEGQALQDAWGPQFDTGLQCVYPLGRILSGMWLIEIYQTDGRILVLYEFDNKVRRIYTDGRGHVDTFPSLMGRSIGRWEDDSLIVETTNLESGFVRYQGLPYTQNLRLTERYGLSEDESKLTVEYTFDDPIYYREPWTVSRIYVRSDHEIRDSECTVQDPTQADLDQ